MNAHRLGAGLAALAMLLAACTVSTTETDEEASTSLANGVAAESSQERSAEPTSEPEVGPCGPAAFPEVQATTWPIPEEPALSQRAIDRLAASPPSTEFDVTAPVVVVDADNPSR